MVVLVAALFVIQPFLRPGLPSIADAPIHMFRTAELDRCWADGVYYPRWAPNLAFGYGYPLFLFAPPLPYFIIELFHILGATLESATKLLAMVCFLLGGMGMYLFVKEVLGAGPAMLAAVAYVYAPFQLREALIYGGNYPQLLAIAFFPFILWAVQRLIVTGRSVYIPVSAFLYGGLILSHNFHALVFSPLLFFYVLFLLSLGGRWRQWRRIVSVGSSVALGLGLTAFFWIPALYERQWCKAQEEFYISRSDFHLRFLDFRELLGFPAPLDTAVVDPYMPFSLGAAILFLAIVGVLVSSLGSIKLAKSRFTLPHEERLHVAFFALVLVVTVFMLLPISTPVWENVPFLATAEFPWRLMGVATLAIAFLAGASLRLWRDVGPFWRPLALLMGSVLLVLLVSAVYLYPPKPFLPYGSPSLAESVRFEWVTQTIGTTTLGEYLPIWVKDVPTTSPMMPAYLGGEAIDKLDREVLPDSAQAEGLGHTVVSDGYRFRSDEAFTARFHTFYFPGWRAYVDGRPVDIEIVEPRGLIAVPVPAGEHEVWVRFGGTPDRAISGFLSLLTLAGSLVVFVAAVLGRRRKRLSMIKATVAARNLPLGQAASLTCVLLALFFVKAVIIDPHTDLFRRRSPPGQVIGIGHPAHVNLGDEVLFLGYDLWDEKVRQGDELRLRLYWQALRPLERDYSSFVHLDAWPDLTTWAGSDNPHPGDARAQI
ncbi:MAG: 6-pyruvoyl-tetrahydropterin synthase-related protein, partial [Anaerolineae bacterium]